VQYSEEAYDANRHKHENFDVQHQQWYPPGPSSSSTSSVTCSTTPVLDTDEEGSGGTLGTGGAPRVVIFTAAYYVCDGVSLTIRKLRAHLQSRGIASRVVSCGPAGWSETDVFTVPSIPLPIINADDNFGYSLGIRLTPECKAQIKAFNPSVIHFTVPDFLALDALRWAKAERIPVMGTWHSNYADYLQFYHLSVIRLPVERFIRSFYVNMPIYVPTPFVRKRLVDSGFPENRVSLWGRGVDLKMFNPNFRSMAFRPRHCRRRGGDPVGGATGEGKISGYMGRGNPTVGPGGFEISSVSSGVRVLRGAHEAAATDRASGMDERCGPGGGLCLG